MILKKHITCTVIVLVISLVLTQVPVFAQGAETDDLEMCLKASGADNGIQLHSTVIDGEQFFFLPSGVKDENMEYTFDEGGVQTMQSANIASMHFFSNDAEKGIEFVHRSKGNSAAGEVFLFDEDFNQIYKGSVAAIKGRGNTTWGFTEKKSYQIKLDKKADLLDPSGGSQKAKKWILLANPYDPTLIRNAMIYNFGKELGLECCCEGRPIDLYYDGEYRGSYYLCEKAEVGDGRVEINDLEKDLENTNPDVDFDALEEVIGNSPKGIEIKYKKGIADPEDITGGYFFELDDAYYKEEASWIRYDNSIHVAVSKSPEYLSQNMSEYLSDTICDAFDYAKGESVGFREGKELSKYIDIESFAKFLLITEWFDVQDTWISSTYMYKDKGSDLIYAGPIWDCDSSMQIRWPERETQAWFTKAYGRYLLGLPTMRQAMQDIYKNEMRPIIYDNLLGSSEGKYLKPAERMKEELAASAAMNYKIWDINSCDGLFKPKETVEANYDDMMSWMEKRAEWFDKQIMSDSFVPGRIKVNQVKSVKFSPVVRKGICKIDFEKTLVDCSDPIRQKSIAAADYQISYRSTGTKKWKNQTTGGKNTYQLERLKKGNTYIIKVRAAARTKPVSGFGKYSDVRRVFMQSVSPKLKAGKKSITVQWLKVPKAKGTQIRISKSKSFNSKKVYRTKISGKKKISGLKSGKKYYVQMRAYKDVSGKRYYTGWSAVKAVKVK